MGTRLYFSTCRVYSSSADWVSEVGAMQLLCLYLVPSNILYYVPVSAYKLKSQNTKIQTYSTVEQKKTIFLPSARPLLSVIKKRTWLVWLRWRLLYIGLFHSRPPVAVQCSPRKMEQLTEGETSETRRCLQIDSKRLSITDASSRGSNLTKKKLVKCQSQYYFTSSHRK